MPSASDLQSVNHYMPLSTNKHEEADSTSTASTVEYHVPGVPNDSTVSDQYHDLYSAASSEPVEVASFPVLAAGEPRSILRRPGVERRSSSTRRISFAANLAGSDDKEYEEDEEDDEEQFNTSDEPSLTYQSRRRSHRDVEGDIPSSSSSSEGGVMKGPAAGEQSQIGSVPIDDAASSGSSSETPRLSGAPPLPPRRLVTPVGVPPYVKPNASTSGLFSQDSSTLVFDTSIDPGTPHPGQPIDTEMIPTTTAATPSNPPSNEDSTHTLNATGETVQGPTLSLLEATASQPSETLVVAGEGGTSLAALTRLGVTTGASAPAKLNSSKKTKKIVVITRKKRTGRAPSDSDQVVRVTVLSQEGDPTAPAPMTVSAADLCRVVAAASNAKSGGVPAIPAAAAPPLRFTDLGFSGTPFQSRPLGVTPVDARLVPPRRPPTGSPWGSDSSSDDDRLAVSSNGGMRLADPFASPAALGGHPPPLGTAPVVTLPVVDTQASSAAVEIHLLPVPADLQAPRESRCHPVRRKSQREVAPRERPAPTSAGQKAGRARKPAWQATAAPLRDIPERIQRESDLLTASVYGAGPPPVAVVVQERESAVWAAPRRASERRRTSKEKKEHNRDKRKGRSSSHRHRRLHSDTVPRHGRHHDHHRCGGGGGGKHTGEHPTEKMRRQRGHSAAAVDTARSPKSPSHADRSAAGVKSHQAPSSAPPAVAANTSEQLSLQEAPRSGLVRSPEATRSSASAADGGHAAPSQQQQQAAATGDREREREDRRAALRLALAGIRVKRTSRYLSDRAVFVGHSASPAAAAQVEKEMTPPTENNGSSGPVLEVLPAPAESSPGASQDLGPEAGAARTSVFLSPGPSAERPPSTTEAETEAVALRSLWACERAYVVTDPQQARQFAESVARITKLRTRPASGNGVGILIHPSIFRNKSCPVGCHALSR
eukprot:gene7221-5074_t